MPHIANLREIYDCFDPSDTSDEEEKLILTKEDCKKMLAQFESFTVNQNEEPGLSAYPVFKAILDFGRD